MHSAFRLILLLVVAVFGWQGGLPVAKAQAQAQTPPAERVPVRPPSPPTPKPALGKGIFVLDDCDEVFKDKERYEDHLTLVDGAGKVGFRVSGINGCQAVGSHHLIAADAARQCVWVSEMVANCIKRYDLSGRVTLTIPLKGAGAIALHPETGHLWAVVSDNGTIDGSRIVVLDDQGQELIRHEEVHGHDIAYDPTENAFWAVGKNVTKVFAVDGLVDFSHRIAEWCAVSIDIDPQSGAAWIAVREHPQVPGSKNQLLKVSRHGKLLTTVELGQTNPFQVSVDPTNGDVWMVNLRHSIERFSSDGELQFSHPIPALAVLADRSGGSSAPAAWVVTATEIQKVGAKGEALLKVHLTGKTGQAWIGAVE